MAGCRVAARVSVEGVADATGVFGAQSLSNIAVGGDVTLWNLANESVDLLEEGHFF